MSKPYRKLLKFISATSDTLGTLPSTKISIFGSGRVGSACAAAFAFNQKAAQICLIDPFLPGKAKAEISDIQASAADINSGISYIGSSDIADSFCSDLCLICFDVKTYLTSNKFPNEFAILQANVDLYRNVIPKITKYNPNTVFVIATYPYNVLTYATIKYSKFTKNRVIGLGSQLDTRIFQMLLAKHFNVSPKDCVASIIGVNMYAVPVWSGITIAGERLVNSTSSLSNQRRCPNDFNEIYRRATAEHENSASQEPCAIATASMQIVKAILNNGKIRLNVSTSAKGHYGIYSNVVMSLSCVLGENGVHSVLCEKLSKPEVQRLHLAEIYLKKLYEKLKLM